MSKVIYLVYQLQTELSPANKMMSLKKMSRQSRIKIKEYHKRISQISRKKDLRYKTA